MDDLVAAFPEGLSGTDLVVQWWRGKGGGQFEGTAARSDIQEGGRSWILLPSMPRSEASAGADPPAILTLQKGRLELHQFSDRGRKALLAKPELSATIFAASAGRGERRRQMTVGTNEATLEELDPATAEILGAAQLDGRPGVELLALLRGTDGRDRLVVVRRR